MSQESNVCCTTSMYDIQNRCIPDEIDLFYFKTCIITHNNNVIEQNINVSMFDIFFRAFAKSSQNMFFRIPQNVAFREKSISELLSLYFPAYIADLLLQSYNLFPQYFLFGISFLIRKLHIWTETFRHLLNLETIHLHCHL